MLFNFTKMHGLGNDMILIDDREEKIRNINEFARRILHRNTGVGADNLLIVRKPSLPGRTGRGREMVHGLSQCGWIVGGDVRQRYTLLCEIHN